MKVKWEEVTIIEHEIETNETDENIAKRIARNKMTWTEDELNTHRRKLIYTEIFKMEVV